MGHLGSGLIYAVPFGLLGFAAALQLGNVRLGDFLYRAAFLNRILESWLVGWTVVRDPIALKETLAVPCSRPARVRRLGGQLYGCPELLAVQQL